MLRNPTRGRNDNGQTPHVPTVPKRIVALGLSDSCIDGGEYVPCTVHLAPWDPGTGLAHARSQHVSFATLFGCL